jgi:hypothetical protein
VTSAVMLTLESFILERFDLLFVSSWIYTVPGTRQSLRCVRHGSFLDMPCAEASTNSSISLPVNVTDYGIRE